MKMTIANARFFFCSQICLKNASKFFLKKNLHFISNHTSKQKDTYFNNVEALIWVFKK